MKKLLIAFLLTATASTSFAQSSVIEGVVQQSEVITGKIGKNGKPILGAAVGAGIGSLFGSGHGKDAAMIAGGLIGARRQAQQKQQMLYGWRYIVKSEDKLHVVDDWCPTPGAQCTGIISGKEVYVINGNEVSVK